MGKGNRTSSKRNTDAIRDLPTMYSEEIQRYRDYAEARKNSRMYTQESMSEYMDKANQYFNEQDRNGKPYTVAGLLLALDINKHSWSRISNGEFDYQLEEYLESVDKLSTENDGIPQTPLIAWSDFAEKCSLKIQAQREEKCSSLRGNPAGNIFLLKAQNGFREDDSPNHVTQNLVICDGEQARKALELLR